MIKVTCEFQTYGSDGKMYGERVLVHSDATLRDRVHIQIGEKKVCVNAGDLITALENATRTNSLY